jgi:hypothetical protein
VPNTAPVHSSAARSQLIWLPLSKVIWSQASICQRWWGAWARASCCGRRPAGAVGWPQPRSQRRKVRSLGNGWPGSVLAKTPKRKRAPQSGWCPLSSQAQRKTSEAASGSRGTTER